MISAPPDVGQFMRRRFQVMIELFQYAHQDRRFLRGNGAETSRNLIGAQILVLQFFDQLLELIVSAVSPLNSVMISAALSPLVPVELRRCISAGNHLIERNGASDADLAMRRLECQFVHNFCF